MASGNSTLIPPVHLAVAYAQHKFRAPLALLLEIDNRLQGILENTREPMIAQIKMAWWREAFENSPNARPKGEPLLQALNNVGDVIPSAALQSLVSAWEILLGSQHWAQDAVATHAELRSDAIFQTYAQWVSTKQGVKAAGQVWATDALRQEFPDRFPKDLQRGNAPSLRSRKLRPLSILNMSVRTSSGPRLVWNALTGL